MIPGGIDAPHAHGDAVRRHRGHPTPSRPAPGPRPGAAPRRSSTSPCRRTGSGSQDGLAAWHAKAAGQLRDRLRLPPDHRRRRRGLAQGDGRARSTRASRASSCSWRTRASSTPTTGRSCGRCRAAADNGSMIMMHAENGSAIDVLVRAGARAAARPTRTTTGSPGRGRLEEEATHRAIMLAEPHRRAAVRRARVGQAGRRAARRRSRPGPERLRRDLPAVPVPVAGGAARRAAGLRGRQVGLLDAAALAGPRATRTTCGRRCAPTTCRWSSTDHCPFCMKEQKELGVGDFSEIPNGIGSVEHRHGPDVPGRRRRARSPWSAGSS